MTTTTTTPDRDRQTAALARVIRAAAETYPVTVAAIDRTLGALDDIGVRRAVYRYAAMVGNDHYTPDDRARAMWAILDTSREVTR